MGKRASREVQVKNTLQGLFQKILKEYAREKGFSLPEGFQAEFNLSHDPAHGDLTTAVAFRLAKLAQNKPARIAEELVFLFEKELQGQEPNRRPVSRWEVAGGGHLNFFIPSSRLAQVLIEIQEKGIDYGKSDSGRGKKVLIEFVSANPTGPLTIAHGRQAVVGDALARILEATGFCVTKEYYLNDTGRQIELLGESLWARYCSLFGAEVSIPEGGYHGEYLKEIAGRLREKKGESILKETRDRAIEECTEFAIVQILQGIQEDLKKVRVEFDSYQSERSLRNEKEVEKAIELLEKTKGVYREEGALWFRSTPFGDDKDRVLRKKTGEYTYLAPDIAYHRLKFERGFVRMINLWGPDHHGYVPRLKAACRALGHDPERLKILIVQLVTLYRKGKPVRMSTRAGEFVTLRELFEEVGVDATRFFFLLRRIESHLDFDLDLAKTQSDENPVYYLQYAHARISSILKFAKTKSPGLNLPGAGAGDPNLGLLKAPEEAELMKKLQEYPEVLAHAAEGLEPYRVVEYLRELAAQFHKFYTFHRVVTEDEELTRARLLLAGAVRIVLRNGLAVLGVSPPETM